MTLTTAQLAGQLGLAMEGAADLPIRGVADLKTATAGDLTFVVSEKYLPALSASAASAAIVPEHAVVPEPHPVLLRAADPDAAFTAACLLFAPPPVVPPRGIHPAAVVSPEAVIGENVSIGAGAVVESGAVIGSGSTLHPLCYVGPGVSLGEDCLLYPGAVIREYCELGSRVILHSGAVIGADGFGYHVDKQGVRIKIPQVGIVVLEDDVEVGANACIDRARFGKTIIGKGTKIDNLVQIAHNCTIGEHSVMCAQVGMAGTTTVGKHVICAGQVGLSGHIRIGDGAVVGAQAGVPKDLPGGQMYLGTPAVPRMEFARSLGHVSSIPKLKEQIKTLAKRVDELEKRCN